MSRLLPNSYLPSRLSVAHKNMLSAIPTRAMSSFVSTVPKAASQNPQAKEWLVIIPDHKGVLQRRYEIRPRHHVNFRRLHKEGHVSFAGPVFTQPCVKNPEKEDRPFMGSVMVLRDVVRDDIYKLLESDLFIQEGIWDWENVKIFPFQSPSQTPQSKIAHAQQALVN
ncbi:YCII-related domain-containing protein [Fusarium heterosporum]|uniref:YCII-related domain-containing protein n=1 Tax=Fusarium heterosporum TaxID=42747 RepID=A0A8H5WEH5_FUSHE|nr:YCII-related domain-containing protein [Fusarium heterosporum]